MLSGVFVLGGFAGWVLGNWLPWSVARPPVVLEQLRQPGYRFINPLLECDAAQEFLMNEELRPFKARIQALVDRVVAEKRAVGVAVYFRDLNNGPWFGINERISFSPASLMKVPVMMGWLYLADADRSILGRQLTWDGKVDLNESQQFRPRTGILPGQPYSVEDLLLRMTAHSDNNAWSVLLQNIDSGVLDRILRDLNVAYDTGPTEDTMTVKSYAAFLRILYNASFLSKEMSEMALELLSHEDFAQGLRAGIPPDVQVASKFGERRVGDDGDLKQLHEFGIIYHARRPYLLGVMTRGTDYGMLAEVLREVSRLIFEEVSAQSHGE